MKLMVTQSPVTTVVGFQERDRFRTAHVSVNDTLSIRRPLPLHPQCGVAGDAHPVLASDLEPGDVIISETGRRAVVMDVRAHEQIRELTPGGQIPVSAIVVDLDDRRLPVSKQVLPQWARCESGKGEQDATAPVSMPGVQPPYLQGPSSLGPAGPK